MDAVTVLAAIQLDPANHGRNVRIEQLMRIALLETRQPDTRTPIPFAPLKACIEDYTDHSHEEDPLSNFFTEVVSFETGNNTVYAGIYAEYGRILNTFSDAIFRQKNALPPAFVKDVRSAMGVFLTVNDSAARDAGHSPLMEGPNAAGNIVVAPQETLDHYESALRFQKAPLKKYCEERAFSFNILADFTLSINDPALTDDDPEKNIVNRKPILDLGDDILLYMPTAIPNVLVEYIYEAARRHNCTAELRTAFNFRKIHLCKRALRHMGWELTDLDFPSTDLPIQELAYRFDNQKIAYVCFVKTGEKYPTAPPGKGGHDLLMERADEMATRLGSIESKQPHQVLTLYVLIESGEEYMFYWRKPAEGNETLSFKDEELLSAAHAEHVDRLTFWKFAKCHRRTNEIAKVEAFGGMIDVFAVFQNNHGSLLHSDEARPVGGILMILPGAGDDLRREVVSKQDEHSARISVGNLAGYAPVSKFKPHAPIYVETDVSEYFRIVIESYPTPIWIINRQTRSFSESFGTQVCEAIAFWLLRVTDDLEPYIKDCRRLPQLEFDVELDASLLDEDAALPPDPAVAGGKPTWSVTAKTIGLKIPAAFQKAVTLPDNTADKLLLTTALTALSDYLSIKGITNDLNPGVINDIVHNNLDNPQAKMLLAADASQNIKRDPRHLVPRRYVQSSDISFILDHLVSYLPAGTVIPKQIKEKDDKKALCTKIVTALIQQLEARIAPFEGLGLLRWLIQLHERYIFEREFNEILIPARIACFSDYEAEMTRRMDGERDLASTGHTLRTLIEFVASRPPTGTRWPNIDDVDELIAFTNQITEWGSLEESIRLGLDDPEIGLLPSGRIGTSKSFERRSLREYAKARAEGDVFKDIEDFEKNYYRRTTPKSTAPDPKAEALNNAFLAEHGCTFEELSRFAAALVGVRLEEGASCVTLSEAEMTDLATDTAGLSADRAKAVLALWTLLQRPSIAAYPPGYSMKDIMTWHYNRDLSAIRRPLVRVDSACGPVYLYGYRHIIFTVDHLVYLLYTGKYPEAKSDELKSWLAGISGEKGNPFRQEVCDWFQKNTNLKVIPHEVNMNPAAGVGHIRTSTDLGDIDLAVIDELNKIFYSLECKNVGGARNIVEMKSEMDKYLGRKPGDPNALMYKHLRRHEWLSASKDALVHFMGDPQTYEIRSIVLTADELSLAYLGKKHLPLPIRSFRFLKKEGIAYLREPPTT